jgi:hypothetical protein
LVFETRLVGPLVSPKSKGLIRALNHLKPLLEERIQNEEKPGAF